VRKSPSESRRSLAADHPTPASVWSAQPDAPPGGPPNSPKVPPKACRGSLAGTPSPPAPSASHASFLVHPSSSVSCSTNKNNMHAPPAVTLGDELPPKTTDTPSAAPSASSAVPTG